ncbi:uncharacterized protein [Battus philenor]|uniref:uncharacterized protein n=1 Tax=Battus philenor TaxID=42288 RepID=UPI0035CF9ACB
MLAHLAGPALSIMSNESSISVYPRTMFEAANEIANLFHEHTNVVISGYGMSALYNLICPNGKLIDNLDPNDFIKAIGCGLLLVESIKSVAPDFELVCEIETLLVTLIDRIEDPVPDALSNEFQQLCIPTIEYHLNKLKDRNGDEINKSKLVKTTPELLKNVKHHPPESTTFVEESGIKDSAEKIDLNLE